MSGCKCTMTQSLLGEGCQYCNPWIAREIAYENTRELEAHIAELEAENQRLREAAEQVVFECEADDDAMMPSVAAVFKLRALLGGGE